MHVELNTHSDLLGLPPATRRHSPAERITIEVARLGGQYSLRLLGHSKMANSDTKGCYLTFTEENNGTLSLNWSESKIDGVSDGSWHDGSLCMVRSD